MALPGQRGYGRDEYGLRSGRSSQRNGGLASAKPGSAMGGDPQMGRKVAAMEMRVNAHDSANRAILEQLMKLQQDTRMEFKKIEHALADEKNQRLRFETAVSGMQNKFLDVEDRLKRAENSSKENKNALAQLISHTKNVERAVTISQQDIMAKKESQAQKLQELHQKLATMNQNKETLERMCYNNRDELQDISEKVGNMNMELKDFQSAMKLQNQMFDKQAAKMRNDHGKSDHHGKLSETQRAAIEAKILQLQTTILDVQSKLNHEIKEREADENMINSRLSDLSAEITDTRRQREHDLKEQETTTRELANMSDAEKQRIIVQISGVQTELKRTLEERDSKMKHSMLHRLDEMEAQLKLESKTRVEAEKDLRTAIEAQGEKTKIYMDESADSLRKILQSEQETLRSRVAEGNDGVSTISSEIADIRSEMEELRVKVIADADNREKVYEAKVEDLSDRLRIGMLKLQGAIGEKGGGNGAVMVNADQADAMYDEELEGIREKVALEISALNDEVKDLRIQVKNQENALEGRLKMQQQAGEDASTIMGDKLQQKMDSVMFTQERLKRQVDDLQEKVQGAPTDIVDVKERLADLEKDVAKKTTTSKETSASSDDLDDIKKDLDYIMGRGEQSELNGTPSLTRLQKDIDDVQANCKTITEGMQTLKEQLTEKIEAETKERTDVDESLKKDLSRADKRTKELKEKFKKLNKGGAGGRESDGSEDEEEGNE